MTLLVCDCASDPPLGATAHALATLRAPDLLFGLGAAALARGARELKVAVRDAAARRAIADAVAQVGAKVDVLALPDAWPAALAEPSRIDAAEAMAAGERKRGWPERTYVTVAGAVAEPAVLAVAPEISIDELVARAGGATTLAWVAIAGGLPAGHLAERDTPASEANGLVLILPHDHTAVRRLRTPLTDWLVRAASACEGCRACSHACAHLSPHDVVWTLATGRDDGVALANTLSCTACGLCDAVCPQSLSPRALVADVRDRLRGSAEPVARPAAAPKPVHGLDVALLTLRLGLAAYDRPPALRL